MNGLVLEWLDGDEISRDDLQQVIVDREDKITSSRRIDKS